MKKTKLPRDPNQKAKLIVDILTETVKIAPDNKNQAAVKYGREGGKKGGIARAKNLTSEQRSEIARKAAQKRWSIKKV